MAQDPYRLLLLATTPLDLDQGHPFNWLSHGWEGGATITQAQWDTALPAALELLWGAPTFPPYEGNPFPDWVSGLEALGHTLSPTDNRQADSALTPDESNHLRGLRWAIRAIRRNNLLEPRIRRIIGSGLTCLIEPREVNLAAGGPADNAGSPAETTTGHQASAPLGAVVLKIPRDEAHRLLTLCMKTYRSLDELEYRDDRFSHLREETFGCLLEARGMLACFASIAMQVQPWEKKAVEHLRSHGVKYKGPTPWEKRHSVA